MKNVTVYNFKNDTTYYDIKDAIAALSYVVDVHNEIKERHLNLGMRSTDYRQKYEEKHSTHYIFTINDEKIEIEQRTRISNNYTYYNMYITINDVETKKDIRYIKKLLKMLEEIEKEV